ncbi:MAG: hypothetical protein QQN43_07690 [Nitrosopumilus sp.]
MKSKLPLLILIVTTVSLFSAGLISDANADPRHNRISLEDLEYSNL